MQSSNPKKIAIIGGAGFIGHNLAVKLRSIGHFVVVIDNLAINNILSFTNEKIKNRKLYWTLLNKRLDLLQKNNIELNVEDARNYNSLSMLLLKYNPNVIIQLAAVSHSAKSNKDPHSTFDHSLRTLENALDVARGLDNCHFIYFSSSMVYGNFKKDKLDEDAPCIPIGIYGNLKYAGELIVKAYNQVFNLPFTIIRPSALYGERCVSRRVGQIFIEHAVQGLDITIHGDGTEKLDFTYIEDLTNGVCLVLEKEQAKNQTFNMTYGEARSIFDIADILKRNFNGIKINFKKKDTLMPERGTLDVGKARTILGYNPKFPIENGYSKYINWYKKIWSSLN